MEKKFEVGQVWRTRGGEIVTIYDIYPPSEGCTYPVRGNIGDKNVCWTADGRMYAVDPPNSDDPGDLVELVTNADGTPASADAAVAQIDGKVFDHTRTEFIEKLTHDLFFKGIGEFGFGCYSQVSDAVREAVKVRDALVRGEQ
ncbi:hypothetical protein KB681_gp38 [Burkholderia phage Mica]|uniref:Uncharacterized protein n=1 Tax=Burkholderia phage Mica TaxID=2767579 RepID=A0A873WTU9_9CAUD|nr:hypothetical protein KB681_gp38 [Burkholderia phage Mica]QPB08674.1 hypothetical protein CPT_Mica_062 [Burkholderia phage Mica]